MLQTERTAAILLTSLTIALSVYCVIFVQFNSSRLSVTLQGYDYRVQQQFQDHHDNGQPHQSTNHPDTPKYASINIDGNNKDWRHGIAHGPHNMKPLLSYSDVITHNDSSDVVRQEEIMMLRSRAKETDPKTSQENDEKGEDSGEFDLNSRQLYIYNRIRGFIREISNCNTSLYSAAERHRNALCFTASDLAPPTDVTASVGSSTPSDVTIDSSNTNTDVNSEQGIAQEVAHKLAAIRVPELNSHCMYLRKSKRERGETGFHYQLAPNRVNIQDGSRTLALYDFACLPQVFLLGPPPVEGPDFPIFKGGIRSIFLRHLMIHRQVCTGLRHDPTWFRGGKVYESFQDDNGTELFNLYAYTKFYSLCARRIEMEIVKEHVRKLQVSMFDLSHNISSPDTEPFANGRRRRRNSGDKDGGSNNTEEDEEEGPVRSKTITIDATPRYYEPDTLNDIKILLPDSKLIITTQDPIERVFNKYLNLLSETILKKKASDIPSRFHRYVLRQLNATTPFDGVISHTDIISKTLELFPRDNLLIINYSDYKNNPIQVFENTVAPFLGIDPLTLEEKGEFRKSNKMKDSSSDVEMHEKTRDLLQSYFVENGKKSAMGSLDTEMAFDEWV